MTSNKQTFLKIAQDCIDLKNLIESYDSSELAISHFPIQSLYLCCQQVVDVFHIFEKEGIL